MKKPQRILIIRTDRLGDVILSTPVIKNLKMAFPEAYVAFMCRPYTKDVLEGNPYLDEVIVYDKYGKDKNFYQTLRFAKYLKSKKFDLALILHPTNRAHLLTYLARIPERIGYDRNLGFLLTKRIVHKKQEGRKHELDYTLDILRFLGIKIVDETAYFPVNEKARKKINNLLGDYAIEDAEKIIAVHPCASCSSKRWPIKNFIKLIDLISKEFKARFILVASEKEAILADELAGYPGIIDLRAKLSISELGALLERADLFISNDSGPVHIAASLKKPVIAIFGRNNPGLSPRRWRPLGDNSFFLHKHPGCEPCLAHHCQKNYVCLDQTKPEEAYELCQKILKMPYLVFKKKFDKVKLE
ncbi:MAG: glycosyltransferase family 9 protein [Candidatus Omnitrophica bacterium]|nr:glycosyltransferase family 9 protein [Candidatus Omnitrophota bacterium]